LNEVARTTKRAHACGFPERTIEELANAYSRRAREARIKQGRPPVINDHGVLKRIAEIMAMDDPQAQRPGKPAA
jgi:hypothetical protein